MNAFDIQQNQLRFGLMLIMIFEVYQKIPSIEAAIVLYKRFYVNEIHGTEVGANY